jgi:hypothetical protein
MRNKITFYKFLSTLMHPILPLTLMNLAITATSGWLTYQCMHFGSADHKYQKTQDDMQNALNLDSKQTLQLCEASFFIFTISEAISLYLLYLNLRTIIESQPMVATILPYYPEATSLTSNTDSSSTASDFTLSSVAISPDESSH